MRRFFYERDSNSDRIYSYNIYNSIEGALHPIVQVKSSLFYVEKIVKALNELDQHKVRKL